MLHGVSLSVPAHGSLTVVGPNGSGKSTLMKTVVGLVRPQEGRVLLEGADVTRLDAPARARMGLGHVPQEANVFRALSVEENLKVAFEFIPARWGLAMPAGWRRCWSCSRDPAEAEGCGRPSSGGTAADGGHGRRPDAGTLRAGAG